MCLLPALIGLVALGPAGERNLEFPENLCRKGAFGSSDFSVKQFGPLEVLNAGTQASQLPYLPVLVQFRPPIRFVLRFCPKSCQLVISYKNTKILKVTSYRQFNHEKYAKMASKYRSKICSSRTHAYVASGSLVPLNFGGTSF